MMARAERIVPPAVDAGDASGDIKVALYTIQAISLYGQTRGLEVSILLSVIRFLMYIRALFPSLRSRHHLHYSTTASPRVFFFATE